MTLEEALFGHKPAVYRFRIFGFVTYAHIPDEKKRKLDDKGEKCVFLSVSDQSKAYKLYNPITKKIVISRNISFDEKSFQSWSNNTIQRQILVNFDEEKEDEKQQQIENQQLVRIVPTPMVTQNVLANSQSPLVIEIVAKQRS